MTRDTGSEHQNDIAALTLDGEGMILECSRTAEKVFGYVSSELLMRHVSFLIPQLERGILIKAGKINPKFSFMCHFGHLFRIHDRERNSFLSELHILELNNSGNRILRVVIPIDSVIPE